MRVKDFLIKRLYAFKYSFQGIKDLLSTEVHAQVQIVIAVLVIIAGFYFKITRLEWALQLLAIGLVLCAETLNTAIEKLADFIHPDFHLKIGRIKDIAAGGVTFSVLAAFMIGLLIYWPYFKKFFITLLE